MKGADYIRAADHAFYADRLSAVQAECQQEHERAIRWREVAITQARQLAAIRSSRWVRLGRWLGVL